MANTHALTTVLLGAGASVGAGIPASVDLTRRIAEEIDGGVGRYHGTTQAMNVAIGAMIAHDTARGADAFRGVDVERLFSAVQMLASRDNLEVSPFVSSWIAALESVGTPNRFPPFFAKSFSKALASSFPSEAERVFKEAVMAVAGNRDNQAVFSLLESQMITMLQSVLRVGPDRIDYLSPLLNSQVRPIHIATLNYDRSVETLARRAGLTLDTGIERWSGGFDWEFAEDADVRLLKMHGSIDWILGEVRAMEGRLADNRVIVSEEVDAQNLRGGALGLVFGQRGKLRSDGPFLAMLREFSDLLSSTDRLVIVGYSFRDNHINAAIRRWFNGRDAPAITIIDPGIDPNMAIRGNAATFLKDLLNTMGSWDTSVRAWRANPPHAFHSLKAEEGLRVVFGDGPPLKSLDEL